MTVPHFSMRQLINAGVHFGHITRRWNPKMGQFIFGSRNGVHILDLQQTVPLLHQALTEVHKVAAKGGRVLFVGTKRQAGDKIAETAKKCGQYYINYRWLGGTLTNWSTVSHSIKTLKQLEERLDTQREFLTKKEILTLTRKKDKLDLALGGIRDMAGIPDIVVVIDTNKEKIAIQESNKLKIPVIAVLDSNSDPDGITFPVPGNDDAKRSIDLYCDLFAAAVLGGMQEEMETSGVDIGESEDVPAEADVANEEAAAEAAPAATEDAPKAASA